jgi:hypothetical protein
MSNYFHQVQPESQASQSSPSVNFRCLTLTSNTLRYLHRSELLILNLDSVIGNANGQFDLSGRDFSKSARNVKLTADGWLIAELRTESGKWNKTGIWLEEWLQIDNGELKIVRVFATDRVY